jgi:hypothetical protein
VTDRRLAPPTDDRGVNTTVGYVLTLGISSLLIVGLLVTAGGFVDDQRQTTIRQELSVIGQQVAGDLSGADRLVRAGGEEVAVRSSLPDEVTGVRYRVEVEPGPGGETTLRFSTDGPRVVVAVTVRTGRDVAETAFDGGDLVVTWTGSELEVRRA